MNRTHLGSDKQAKLVLLKDSFRGEIHEKSDYVQANTARSHQIKFSKIQKWLTLRWVGLHAD